MGADGRSWAGLFSLLALAILLAFLRPEPFAEPRTAVVVAVDPVDGPEPAAATFLVASR